MNEQATDKPELYIGLAITVRELRRECGLTQRELAEAAGTKTVYISHIECARVYRPTFDIICRLADALHVTVDEFRERLEANS